MAAQVDGRRPSRSMEGSSPIYNHASSGGIPSPTPSAENGSRSDTRMKNAGFTKVRSTDGNADEKATADDDDEINDDEDEEDGSNDDEDVLAPSEAVRKRSHQTGLSVSLSNTSLGKRGRSPSSDEADERPMSKMSRTSGDVDVSDEDDEAYNAVDQISESEEEDDVEQREEKMIIDSEEEDDDDDDENEETERTSTSTRPRRGSQSSADSFLGLEEVEDGLHQPETRDFFNELFPEATSNLLEEDEAEGPPAPTGRRVRFAEDVELHSSSSTTDSDDEDDVVYPDLFLQQDSLDPAFRKLIEQRDADEQSSDVDSYWDLNEENAADDVHGDDESVTESDSSGYETDEGETTDEEILPPRTVSSRQISLRQSARANVRAKPAATLLTTPTRRTPSNLLRRGPTMGSFLIDEDKPVAVVDGHGKHMLFFPALKHRRQAHAAGGAVAANANLPGTVAYNATSETESDIGFTHTDPMLSSPANVMMSGLGTTRARAGSGLSTEITGPPEAFFPFTNINSSGAVEIDDVDEDDLYDDFSDEDENLRIEDFINFGDDDDDDDASSDEGEGQDLTDSNNTTGEEQLDTQATPRASNAKFPALKSRGPSTPTPAASSGSLLEHFDKGVVSSFRRNNDRHKQWTRNPSNIGIKGSRLHAANAPISPLRRRRGGSMSLGTGRSPLRPPSREKLPPSVPSSSEQFGSLGPIKKRIQNSNRVKRNRKNTL